MILSRKEAAPYASGVEDLTLAAKDAAEEGRWDLVTAYYARRGEQFAGRSLSPQDSDRLLKLDQEIQVRIKVAQTALMAVIQDSGRALQRLNGLSHRLGASASEPGILLLKA